MNSNNMMFGDKKQDYANGATACNWHYVLNAFQQLMDLDELRCLFSCLDIAFTFV